LDIGKGLNGSAVGWQDPRCLLTSIPLTLSLSSLLF